MTQTHYRALVMLVVYLILRFIGGSFGQLVLYPVTLLVTFLHDFGHALGALLSGGSVVGLNIAPDGSGYTTTRGGSAALILMGGYLGSAILGNILFYIGVRKKTLTDTTLKVLAGLMAFSGIIWFESFVSTGLLFVFAVSLWLIAARTNWDQDVLMFLGLAAVLYIIQDFRVGPQSDLAKYEQVVGIFPAQVWTYIWLGAAAILFYLNLRQIFGRRFFKM